MPKAYSQQEREQIKEELRQEALDCLGRYGVRKTTVDELVRRVHIPKGTFYLFYESKEILLFEAINQVHDAIQTSLAGMISGMAGCSPEELTDVIYSFYKMADQTNLIRIMTAGDMELLVRKLPEKVIEDHFKQDAFSLEQIAKLIPGAEGKELCCYESAFRAIFCTMMHKKEIGEDNFDETIKLLLQGLIRQLAE